MNGSDEAGRISHLCAVLARTTARMDPETVLTEVVDGVGARYGVLITVDESGGPREFVIEYLDRGAPHYAGVVTHPLPN